MLSLWTSLDSLGRLASYQTSPSLGRSEHLPPPHTDELVGLILSLTQRGAIVDAVTYDELLAAYFKALDKARPTPRKQGPKGGVTKAGATGVGHAIDTPWIEIRI